MKSDTPLMAYLEKFQEIILSDNLHNFLQLWEEYCLGEGVDAQECKQILESLKQSALAIPFGAYAESALTLWRQVHDQAFADEILALILDLQTTNSPLLMGLATDYLNRKFSGDPDFAQKERIVGLKGGGSFQGCITNFELLTHMAKERFVFHCGGWGAGEVMEFSLVGEHARIEFEGAIAPKEMSFHNAFRFLKKLNPDHFLAQRFGNPDQLEKRGREDPLFLVHLALKDLGSMTAQDMKDELLDLVIPQEDWGKWWQQARAKMKKDPLIDFPAKAKNKIVLRKEGVTPEKEFVQEISKLSDAKQLIHKTYQFAKTFPNQFGSEEIKNALLPKVNEAISKHEKIQTSLDAATVFELQCIKEELGEKTTHPILSNLPSEVSSESVLNYIEHVSFKKRYLVSLKHHHKNWAETFLKLLFLANGNTIKDYLLTELLASDFSSLVETKLLELVHKVTLFPDAFFWYFQKIALGNSKLPLDSFEHRRQFLEAFFVLYHYLESEVSKKELLKKMHHFFTANKYLVIREIIQGASKQYLSEILLLSTKCYSLSKHDRQILQSLAEVVDPSLKGEKEIELDQVIWTTAKGLENVQQRIHQLGTVEMVENAKEIEAARALGDLRENSEYKFALEKRSQLQAEMKMLSDQVSKARILTSDDIVLDTVCVGSVVKVSSGGDEQHLTILGPWDADTEKNIFSFQSKFAKQVLGKKVGETFSFQDKSYTIQEITSFLK